MKKLVVGLFVLASTLLSSLVFAQTKFEQGYFIDSNGNRTECLIRNSDWIHSPRSIRYKATANGEQITKEITEIKEFGVAGERYICRETRMDTSSQTPRTYSNSRAPEWDMRYIALRVLVEGKATLYHYDDGTLSLFFYSVDNSPLEQLEYKAYNYYVDREKYMKEGLNLTYINQLKEKLSCGDVYTHYALNKFRYKPDFLVDYFKRYNKCSGGNADTKATRNKAKFYLKITPGLNLATAKVNYTRASDKFADTEPTFRIGLEPELVLPLKSKKLSLFVEPTYVSLKTEKLEYPIDYKAIELPAGVRHYFFLNDDAKIFLNASVVFNLMLEVEAQITPNYKLDLSEKRGASYAFGGGASYKRFSLEFRYYTPHTTDDRRYESTYKQMTFIAGFRLF